MTTLIKILYNLPYTPMEQFDRNVGRNVNVIIFASLKVNILHLSVPEQFSTLATK
jgi:hypothetical protein